MTYSSTLVGEARRMRDAGWSPSQIAAHLTVDTPVAVSTVRRWVDDDYARRRLVRQRREAAQARARAGGRLGRSDHTLELLVARVRGLREAGVPVVSIARVMTFDFGETWTRHRVERALEEAG